MNSKGIRILDSTDDVVSVKLSDILNIIPYEDSLNWAILFSDLILVSDISLEEGKSIIAKETQINKSPNGVSFSWEELQTLSKKIHQEIDLIIVGCRNKEFLHKYQNDQEMYESCDIVIQMIDSSYWEVFSKDDNLIARLAQKFKEVEFLEPNFER